MSKHHWTCKCEECAPDLPGELGVTNSDSPEYKARFDRWKARTGKSVYDGRGPQYPDSRSKEEIEREGY